MSRLLITLGFCMGLFAMLGFGKSPVREDERIVFFTTFAHRDGDQWRVPVHGIIFEPEANSRVRREAISAFGRLLGLNEQEREAPLFRERALLFLADNERNKEITIRIGEKSQVLSRSLANGHFEGELTLSGALVDQHAEKGPGGARWLPYHAVLSTNDKRLFRGKVLLVEPTGLSIISDVDDTIKITEVRDKRAVLRNTLLKEFEPVPGMPERFKAWQARGAVFHYISGSPWQLYEPLDAFLAKHRYPPGTFNLKHFRIKDRNVLSLFGTQEEYKGPLIERLLTTFPQRRFILVGDSGEQDPEIYGTAARKYPSQVESILIRDATGESADSERYRQAFRDVPRGKWSVINDP
jgi:hypothetical protein